MTDYVEVVEANPVLFVKTVVEKIQEGYYVHNTIPGYPTLMGYAHGNIIRLFKGEKPAVTKPLTDERIVVLQYDPMFFMLDVQNAALQGYTVDLAPHLVDFSTTKCIGMVRNVATEAPKEETKPAAKTTRKKALKAEPTIKEMEETNGEAD